MLSAPSSAANGATAGVGVLATYWYDDLGRRTSVTRGNGTTSSYGFDNVSRLTSLGFDLAGTASDQSEILTYNPASQIASAKRSNTAYVWTGAVTATRPYTSNGLNQYSGAGTTSLGYDARGNLTTSGATTYAYTGENRLKSMSGGIALYYDPIGRLSEYDTSTSTRFVYDGGGIATEVANPSGAVLRRYVPGANADEPVVWYEGAGTSDRQWLVADERGSVVAVTDSAGSSIATNSYDEYGIPGGSNSGRFQYTGQAWLPELGMYYYKARMYSATLGRFMQTDPIGYGDGLNFYTYAQADPINGTDSTGLCNSGVELFWNHTVYTNGQYNADKSFSISLGQICFDSNNGFDGGSYGFFGGERPTPQKPGKDPTPCDDSINNRSRFFQQLPGMLDVARQVNVPGAYIVGLASYESGWFDDHNVALNNLWGLTQTGGNNIKFSSVASGNAYFVQHVGPFIQNSQTVATFFAGLKKEGYNSAFSMDMTKGMLFNRIANINKWAARCSVVVK